MNEYFRLLEGEIEVCKIASNDVIIKGVEAVSGHECLHYLVDP